MNQKVIIENLNLIHIDIIWREYANNGTSEMSVDGSNCLESYIKSSETSGMLSTDYTRYRPRRYHSTANETNDRK